MKYYIARDKQNTPNGVAWQLQDLDNGQYIIVSDIQLKEAIQKKKVVISNLTLTSDNRLVLASEYKTIAVEDLRKAPISLQNAGIQPATKDMADRFEASMDAMIAAGIEQFNIDYKDYAKAKMLDADKNMIAVGYEYDGHKCYVIARYEKVVYGYEKDGEHNEIYGEIWMGIEALRIDSKLIGFNKGASRLTAGIVKDFFYVDATREISDEIQIEAVKIKSKEDPRELADIETYFCVIDSEKFRQKNNGKLFVLDSAREKSEIAEGIARILSDHLGIIVAKNEDLYNCTEVINYAYQAQVKKENRSRMVKAVVGSAGLAGGTAIVMGAVVTGIAILSIATSRYGDMNTLSNALGTARISIGQIIQNYLPQALWTGGLTSTAVASGFVNNTIDDIKEAKEKNKKEKERAYYDYVGRGTYSEGPIEELRHKYGDTQMPEEVTFNTEE